MMMTTQTQTAVNESIVNECKEAVQAGKKGVHVRMPACSNECCSGNLQ